MQTCSSLASVAALLLLAPIPFAAEEYQLPPDDIVAIADAPPPPSLVVAPDGGAALVFESSAMPSVAELARPTHGLAGIVVDPAARARYRTGFYRSVHVRDMNTGGQAPIAVPAGERIAGASFSHTGRAVAMTTVGAEGTSLWFVRTSAPEAPLKVTGALTAVLFRGYAWMPDGERIVFAERPADLGDAPLPPAAPSGPIVQATSADKTPLRTYRDLLDGPHDEALFEHHAASVLALFDPRIEGEGRVSYLGDAGLYADVSPAPDGKHLLVERIHRPYSYLMPASRFPMAVDVVDPTGALVRRIVDLPLAEQIPIGGVRTGPRSLQWKAGEPATLVWVEALDGGDPELEVPHRDRWMTWRAPFEEPARELVRTEQRASSIAWTNDPERFVVREYDRDRRWIRALLAAPTGVEFEPKVLENRSLRDSYGNPGSLMMEEGARGVATLRQDGDWVYRAGEGASPAGPRPFLVRQNLETLETERLWQATPGSYERVVGMLASGSERRPSFVTLHESADEPPNYRMRDLESQNAVVALTEYEDPAAILRQVSKQLVTYERADGVPLSATLYLPPGYDAERDGRLPLFVWAYPLEYNDVATAGQVRSSPHRFTRLRGASHLYLVLQGYAVLDGAAMPVVGDAETMNDTFVEQVVASARAAIDVAVRMGVADPSRVGVGGHSYGAFMTANLLAHSDLFRAGIARSGAYNRTLTPFGFQSERRTVWDAPELYAAVSPFFHADDIDEPLLMIHGAVDSNSGTHPMQSERLFGAIKGNGGTARLVMLPAENHGYRGRESVLHTLYEMGAWLDRYVKEGRAEPVEAAVGRDEAESR